LQFLDNPNNKLVVLLEQYNSANCKFQNQIKNIYNQSLSTLEDPILHFSYFIKYLLSFYSNYNKVLDIRFLVFLCTPPPLLCLCKLPPPVYTGYYSIQLREMRCQILLSKINDTFKISTLSRRRRRERIDPRRRSKGRDGGGVVEKRG